MTSIDNTSSTPEMPTTTFYDADINDMHERVLRDTMTMAIERHMVEWSKGPREAMSRRMFHQHIADEIVLTIKLLGYPDARNWVMYCGDDKFKIGLKLEGLITMVELNPNE
jgi:hypothetical protein